MCIKMNNGKIFIRARKISTLELLLLYRYTYPIKKKDLQRIHLPSSKYVNTGSEKGRVTFQATHSSWMIFKSCFNLQKMKTDVAVQIQQSIPQFLWNWIFLSLLLLEKGFSVDCRYPLNPLERKNSTKNENVRVPLIHFNKSNAHTRTCTKCYLNKMTK